MSVKIKVSYQHPEELNEIVKYLAPMGITCKVAKKQQGQYKNAYIERNPAIHRTSYPAILDARKG